MLSGDGVAGVDHSVPAESAPNEALSVESSQPALSGSLLDGVVLPILSPQLRRVVEGVEGQIAALAAMDTVALTAADRRALVTRMETAQRVLFGLSHTWIADLIAQHGLDIIDASVPLALAVLMRISPARAGHRIRCAEQFGARTAISGERLSPVRAATAAAAAEGVLDEQHQELIRKFFRKLQSKVDAETLENADRQLARAARDLRPDQLEVFANRLYDLLDPDGDLPPEQVADQTYVRFGDQDENGLSKMTGLVDAEFRAYCEAAFAKWAKPGMCNPADASPVVDEPDTDGSDTEPGSDQTGDSSGPGGQDGPTLFDHLGNEPDDDPDDDAADSDEPGDDGGSVRDVDSVEPEGGKSLAELDAERRAKLDQRGQGRRQHDAMKMILRQMLASGTMGQHRGLPVTAVITMTLKELEAGAGHAVTATGSLVKMRDAIRMASHAHHYLVVFDNDGRPLYLGRDKRIASADQRIVLTATDRGCTHPGCTRPATRSQVHHVEEWAHGGNTDIDILTLACDQHHSLVGPADTDWATTIAGPDHPYPGRTLWHPPVTIDPSRRGRINHYHHPHEYLYPDDPDTVGPPPS